MAYIKRTTRTDETVEVEYFYTAGKHNSAATRKQAVERLRRLVNTNFKENSIKLELSYTPKTHTSLLTVNK